MVFSWVAPCLFIAVLPNHATHAAFSFAVPSKRPWVSCRMSSLGEDTNTEKQLAASTLRSMTFCNLDKDKEPQLLSEFLLDIGACSTAIIDADRDTPREQAIYQEPGDDPWENQAAVICGDAAVGRNVWNRCNVSAHFPSSMDLKGVAELVQDVMNIPLEYSVQQVPDRDWVVHVQQSWKPIVVSGMVIRFPWHSNQDVEQALINVKESEMQRDAMAELQLEGGIAFGTGEHPTTQLCLSWIQQQLPLHSDKMQLMDYGAGSGVLGLAACALSHHVTAVGVDIDADAVRIANANAAANGLAMSSYLPPLKETDDNESKSLLIKAHQKLLDGSEILPDRLNGPIYDACVANILAAPLVTLAPTIASLVRTRGSLGLSGILEPQADMVMEAYAPYFTDLKVDNVLDGWIIITGTRATG